MRLLSTFAVGIAGLATVTATTLATAPTAAASQARDPGEVVSVAHRGARYVAPENTLAAIRAGIDRGVDMIEIDVQRSKDGRLVLVHDQDLLRTTNVEKVFPRRASYAVGDFTYRHLRRLDAGSWKAKKYAGVRIPSLKQAIRVIKRHRAGLMLEMKAPQLYPGIEAEVAKAIRSDDNYAGHAIKNGQLVVQSFNFGSAHAFKQLEPRIPVALLGTPPVTDLPVLATWADLISAPHRSVDATYVSAVHASGMECLVWTIDRADNINAALDKGVDGVVTNRPNVLGKVLQRRSAAAPSS